ncbi:MAG: HlyC/CorC family transporter [Prolixibacteraceae bacterium]|nr:HlyC/CorC family transporter [Prolixibacteraceae bacterium]
MELIVLGFLILLNGFFALSEAALISSKRARLEQFKVKGKSGAKVAMKLLENSENFLSAIQVGITLIGIVTGVYGGVNIADDITPFFNQFELTREFAHEIALSLTVLAITYISIVIGELVPKTIALSNPEKISIRVAPIVFYFSKVFYPFVRLLALSTKLINKIIGLKQSEGQVTEQELRHMLKFASNEGVIEEEQNRMHEKVFYFSDKKAKHIMTHRKDVEWIDAEQKKEEIHEEILNLRHSKIIVGRNSIDEFTGVLNVKEYLINFYSPKPEPLDSLLSEPLVIPENADAQRVLDLFREKQNYMAVVVDEYGSFEGIITLHDIIENIIGSVPEEGETPEPEVFVREDQTVLVSGDAPIETLVDLIEDFYIDFDEIDYSTVAGYVFNQINKIPELGDKVVLSDCIIEVVDIDNNKIDKVLITKKK